MGGDEVLEDGHAFAEVAPHGDFDDPAGRVGHEAAHAAELADLALVAAGTGHRHHLHGAAAVERVHHGVRHCLRRALPDVDDLVVPLVLRDEAVLVLVLDLRDFAVGTAEQLGLRVRDHDVAEGDGHPTPGRVLEPDALDAVDDVGRLVGTATRGSRG